MEKIKIINKSPYSLPKYETPGSSGLDVRGTYLKPITLKPMERVLIKTELFAEIPQGLEIQVRPRSGLALKHGITVLNSPGTIDSDYRGEIGVILINLGTEDYTLGVGDKVAQLVVATVTQIEFQEVESLDETIRGTGGYGHTSKYNS